ncbi:helix-turn-helix domain-containing protein [Rhodococcus aetherivorans]|nr:helix-turn-helix domain-containing protein [Rhodococcus aetherivorans]
MTVAREVTGREPTAVQRALALLEAVAQLGSGATAKDLARLTRIPPATAYRLLNLLVADGYLVRVHDLSGFALGRRTQELAAAPHAETWPVAEVLEDLRAQVRHGVYLASYERDRIRLVDRDPDHELLGESSLTRHLHASAIGKLLLADRPHLVPGTTLPKVGPRTIVELDRLAIELSRIRSLDVSVEQDELRQGRTAVAVPVRDDGAAIVGCLAAIGGTGRIRTDDRDLIDLLHEFAGRLRLPGAARRT